MNDNDLRPEALFDLSDPTTAAFFEDCDYVWQALTRLEEHVRRLTGAIAQRRFPPAMVRNWQVDLRRIQEALAKA